jgi:hypothetical protein
MRLSAATVVVVSVCSLSRRCEQTTPPRNAPSSGRARTPYASSAPTRGSTARRARRISVGVDRARKPAKQTAGKMWNMVVAINRDSFAGSDPVTCWTCHRGSVRPESLPAQPNQ